MKKNFSGYFYDDYEKIQVSVVVPSSILYFPVFSDFLPLSTAAFMPELF